MMRDSPDLPVDLPHCEKYLFVRGLDAFFRDIGSPLRRV
jgi:hypothetical protein